MNWKEVYLNAKCVKRFRESQTDNKRKSTDVRSEVESDFGRVVFCPASRRLHDKTQVFPLTSNDNIHSRLTHSLEVMNIGLSFSIDLSEHHDFLSHTGLAPSDVLRSISAILKTSCLVHDIGNPPFGHFGETVIQDYFAQLFETLKDKNSLIWKGIIQNNYLTKEEKKNTKNPDRANIIEKRKQFQIDMLNDFLGDKGNDWRRDYTEFDGNAEGLRVLTKLQNLGDLFGLNLTFATIAATIKYPNTSAADEEGWISAHKHGVMMTEENEMKVVSEVCNMKTEDGRYFRHPLAFLMEAADSICYLTMDIDDALSKKWMSFNEVYDLIKDSDEPAKDIILDQYNRILDNNKTERKKWMSLRTAILSFLIDVAVKNFVKNLDEIERGVYSQELIEDKCPLTKALQKFTRNKILSKRDINLLETTGKSVISGLLNEYIRLMFHPHQSFRNKAKVLLSRSLLCTVIMEHIQSYPDMYKEKYGDFAADDVLDDFDIGDLTVEERLRVIRDYVAGMTDKFALNHYRELSGQRLP